MPTQAFVSTFAAVLFAAAFGLLGAAVEQEPAARIPVGKLKDHVGRLVIVCGRVVTHDCEDNDRSTTLDLDKPYWEQAGAVLISEQARRNFPPRLEDGYVLGDICATGRVERRERRYVVRVERPTKSRLRNRRRGCRFRQLLFDRAMRG
jgi:hypothetical protein